MEKTHLESITVGDSRQQGPITKEQAMQQIRTRTRVPFYILLNFHKIFMSQPLTQPCASDHEGLWINFPANRVQAGAQATSSSYHRITFQNSISSLKPACPILREKR